MARIAGIDLPKNKRGVIGLTYIFGIGRSRAQKILKDNGIDESVKDLASSLEGNYLTWRASKDGNLSFRLAHLNERLTYVFDDIKRWPMGIGFIHEDSAAAQNLGFKIGLINPLTARAVQVDTGDIAWSVVVMKTGFIGLGLMLLFVLASYLAVGASNHMYVIVYRGGLLYFLITSFFSINFVMPNYMIPLMLFLALALLSKELPMRNEDSASSVTAYRQR